MKTIKKIGLHPSSEFRKSVYGTNKKTQLRRVAIGDGPCPYGEVGDYLNIGYSAQKLRITEQRKENLSKISNDDILKEGIPYWTPIAEFIKKYPNRQYRTDVARSMFVRIWDTWNPSHPYDSDPIVWVITYVHETGLGPGILVTDA